MQSRRLIDVRQPDEFAAGYIEGSELVPLGHLSRTCEEWDRSQPITLICRSGHRAELARRQLSAVGFTDVVVLTGGIQGWLAAGQPIQIGSGAGGVHPFYRWSFRVGLVLVCIALARLVSPWFLVIPAVLSLWWAQGPEQKLNESFRAVDSESSSPSDLPPSNTA